MGVTDKIKGAAAAVQDKVTGEKQHAATTAKVQTLLPHQPWWWGWCGLPMRNC